MDRSSHYIARDVEQAAARRKGWGSRARRLPIVPLTAAVVRAVLVRYVRATPRTPPPGDRPRVVILTVSAWGKGGTTRAVINLAGYLCESYRVEIISLWRVRDEPFFAHPPEVTVTTLDDLRPVASPRGLRGLPRGALARLPSVLAHPGDRWARSFSLLSDIRLARRLRRGSGVLISTRPALNLSAAALSPPGFALIGQEHMHLGAYGRLLKGEIARAYLNLDAFVTLTEGAKRDYDDLLGGRVPVVVIPNTASHLGGRRADLSARKVLAAGRLTTQKGFDLLIAAWAEVAVRHPDWRLRICGEGQLHDELESQIDERGLRGRVELPGLADMDEEMTNASIFVLSSRYEGFPLILLEAMSKGMAVVSFDCPTGPADVIAHRHNGLLVAPEDVSGLADALREMVEDEELRRRCASATAKTAGKYHMDTIGPMWEALLHKVTP
jgi:glycosyltransferase involved in cell wall biosynthesis